MFFSLRLSCRWPASPPACGFFRLTSGAKVISRSPTTVVVEDLGARSLSLDTRSPKDLSALGPRGLVVELETTICGPRCFWFWFWLGSMGLLWPALRYEDEEMRESTGALRAGRLLALLLLSSSSESASESDVSEPRRDSRSSCSAAVRPLGILVLGLMAWNSCDCSST